MKRLKSAWLAVLEHLEAVGRTANSDILGPETREEWKRTREKNRERRARYGLRED